MCRLKDELITFDFVHTYAYVPLSINIDLCIFLDRAIFCLLSDKMAFLSYYEIW